MAQKYRKETVERLCAEKAELTARVAELTQEIDRLYRENQRLENHCREVMDLILPNESAEKCDFRRVWALRELNKLTGEDGDE